MRNTPEVITAKQSLATVDSPCTALDWWCSNRAAAQGTTLVVSHTEPSNLLLPTQRAFGSIQLLSIFSAPNLTILNDRIAGAMLKGQSPSVGIDHLIAFDTNAASFLRGLFNDRSHRNIDDLKTFLTAFQGNKVNWDIRPYLNENACALLAGDSEREIYETVLASEQLSALDVPAFLSKGELTTNVPIDTLRGRAGAEIAKSLAGFRSGGWMNLIKERYEPIYASVLYMAILARSYPGRPHAAEKLKLLIKFMDEGLVRLFWAVLWVAWRWFDGERRTAFFDTLQPGGKEPVKTAKNMSWDLFHMLHQPQAMMTSRKGADVLISVFLTADQKLGRLWDVYPVRSCWARNETSIPYSAPALNILEHLPKAVVDDHDFSRHYLTGDAIRRRRHRAETNACPPLNSLIGRLEDQLLELSDRPPVAAPEPRRPG